MSYRNTSTLFTAVVINSNAASHAVTVIRESYGTANTTNMSMLQGTVVSSVMTAFLGFKESTIPQPGSRVLCVEESDVNCFVLGVIPPESAYKELQLSSRAMLGAKDASDDSAHRMGHSNYTTNIYDVRRPTDIVDGEHVVSNEFGVLLGLYQQLATLKASELSQIQCFLLDDLVRIISHNFQHYTALGEYNIYHDGKRLMAEFGATHIPAEAYGKPAVESEVSDSIFEDAESYKPEDNPDFYKIKEDERIKAIERFKLFLGSVGDFVHLFIVRPNPQKTRILDPESSSEGSADTGLCDVHIGTDGGLHIRSVKEVFLEKTNWIRVPTRKSAPDDPNGDDASELEYSEKEKFNFNNEYKYKENPFNFALQIRDYVAYVNEKLGYQNFKSHEKDFFVNDKIDEEESIASEKKIDKETKLDLSDYQLRTAGIYLMPNGGVTIRDAWNSAIVMEGGNISIQPAKDMMLQPLRSMIVKAGGNLNMSIKKHIDINSSEESVRVKSSKGQYFYSDVGGIILESAAEESSLGELESEKALENLTGIVLKSKTDIYNSAENDIVNNSKNRIMFKSLEAMSITSDEDINMYTKKTLRYIADEGISAHSDKDIMFLSSTNLFIAGASGTAIGQKDSPINVKSLLGVKGVLKVQEMVNQQKFSSFKKDNQDIWKKTIFKSLDKFEMIKFRYLESSKYGKLSPDSDGISATLAQQDDLLTGMYSLEEWKEEEINETLPYPGKELYDNFYYSTEKPLNLEENSLGKDYSSKSDAAKEPAKINLESLNKYKVQSAK